MEINTFWIGKEFSTLEILSVKSHLLVGHNVVIWSYEDIKNVPEKAIIKDAREILPEKDVFAYKVGEGKGSYSACSNLFRYKFLLEKGGWWCDTDVVALKYFDFKEDYVFASESTKKGSCMPTTCVIKAPINSDLMRKCWNVSSNKNREDLEWGTIGPYLLSSKIFELNLEEHIEPFRTFCPVDWFVAEIDPIIPNPPDISKSYSVHLWNEMWRRSCINKDGKYDSNCLYEVLKNAILHT